MKKLSLLLFIVFLVGITALYAPPFNPPDGGAPLGGPVGAPIDGGLGALIVAGIAFVGKKFYNSKKKQNKNV